VIFDEGVDFPKEMPSNGSSNEIIPEDYREQSTNGKRRREVEKPVFYVMFFVKKNQPHFE